MICCCLLSIILFLVISFLQVTIQERADGGLLANWNLKTFKAYIKASKDASVNYTTIGDAMLSLPGMKCDWTGKVIICVNVDSFLVVTKQWTNLMLGCDGINQTMATIKTQIMMKSVYVCQTSALPPKTIQSLATMSKTYKDLNYDEINVCVPNFWHSLQRLFIPYKRSQKIVKTFFYIPNLCHHCHQRLFNPQQ